MSRIGNQVIRVPDGVTVTVKGSRVTVKGPKGQLEREFHPAMEIVHEDGELKVNRPSDRRDHRSLHGLTGALLVNMVTGVTEGFEKKLEIVGVGYRAESAGKALRFHVGYSHPITYEPPEGVNLTTESPTVVAVSGTDKEKVGQAAAEIRALRPPEPYKGKGIKYLGEQIRRKAGKTAL
ncbi:MAG: 50S ribosomal protein L6 [Gemmatimonadetes bacterium]|uniref:Large ribosomal subunit protein uL6 n=1 Tax=Candidatus Kutchimonas denitrificans TaxID=3056748 RepID=A0AAE5C9V8_9BACT|nr:50S ribosomal protein L6 [Gemmatimonadota bacterium]NIR73862.1 50S ribosomal protein L6 [Candidatus Kutchimonas denitrificans]NIR99668.1 50S ribosomal protein L6 [Gemmatimonadota bacterium]NIT65253.1 50S ribosomal protein L6 [Gemmatimonadota bacterium]NIW73702.1 50S ribosomal protein L6 [Gemmatimonadota bacterium]